MKNSIVVNPYSKCDWSSPHRKAILHAHTDQSWDAMHPPNEVIDAYVSEGFEIIAITDHSYVTWPWSKWDRDPETLGVVGIQANEDSDWHHTLSWFNGYVVKSGSHMNNNERLRQIRAHGGLAAMAHPALYHGTESVPWYRKLFRDHPGLLGMECHQRNETEDSRAIWDGTLALTMPGRPVWGFAGDDLHVFEIQFNLRWIVIPLNELSLGSVRKALERGAFYPTWRKQWAVEGDVRELGDPPTISEIVVDEAAGTIEVIGQNYNSIGWVSVDGVIEETPTLEYAKNPDVKRFARCYLENEFGYTTTQPFGFRGPTWRELYPWATR